ncbi:hypothetical protein M0802_006097 [Mischocyttarus mexicanus]|nr:hypothetical protein M0802_006097 [Mischocyttarus mexicanus]
MKEFDEMKKSVKKYVDDYFTNYFIELIVNYEPNFQHSNITFEEYLETELKKFEEENKEKLINKEEEIFLGVPKVDEKEDYLDDTSVSKQSSDICDKFVAKNDRQLKDLMNHVKDIKRRSEVSTVPASWERFDKRFAERFYKFSLEYVKK